MGIKVGSNFDLEAAEFLDSRNSTNTISSLTSDFTTSNTPEGFEVFVKEKGKWYQATKNTNKIVWNERPSGYVDLKGYATESWVKNKNYITSTSLNGYATELWVSNKNYITASALNGYATQSWVNEQAFLKANALNSYSTTTQMTAAITTATAGMATQNWVGNQGFLKVADVNNKVDKITPQKQSYALANVNGTLSAVIPQLSSLSKVLGLTAEGNPATAETTEFKSVDTSLDEPGILQLIEKGTDRVDFPNLNRIYFNCGNKWGFIQLVEVS